jgi:hypothetical protein
MLVIVLTESGISTGGGGDGTADQAMGFGADEVYYPAMTAYTLTDPVVRSVDPGEVRAPPA